MSLDSSEFQEDNKAQLYKGESDSSNSRTPLDKMASGGSFEWGSLCYCFNLQSSGLHENTLGKVLNRKRKLSVCKFCGKKELWLFKE